MQIQNVLFVCTHNSARSQMAEGLLRTLAGDRYAVYSAGTEPRGVHPLAARAMSEAGIDCSHHRSKHVEELDGVVMDFVVTVCDAARERCPYVPARIRGWHRGFEDPSASVGSEAERLAAFRRVRDEIRAWLEDEFITHKPALGG